MQPYELQSVSRFMHEHLFDHVDIKPSNIHIPDGAVPKAEVAAYCQQYEQQIGTSGESTFNCWGSTAPVTSGSTSPAVIGPRRTRMITLDNVTRTDAASDFFGAENVPRYAITMGVGTILEARRILLLAFGEGKAAIVAKTIEGYANAAVPATFLQDHPNTLFLLDEAAASNLTRFQAPWLLGEVDWDPTHHSPGGDRFVRGPRQGDLEIDRCRLQRTGLARPAGCPRQRLRHQPPCLSTPSIDDYRLARRQTRTRQASWRPARPS